MTLTHLFVQAGLLSLSLVLSAANTVWGLWALCKNRTLEGFLPVSTSATLTILCASELHNVQYLVTGKNGIGPWWQWALLCMVLLSSLLQCLYAWQDPYNSWLPVRGDLRGNRQ